MAQAKKRPTARASKTKTKQTSKKAPTARSLKAKQSQQSVEPTIVPPAPEPANVPTVAAADSASQPATPLLQKVRRFAVTRRFERLYLLFGLLVLFATTLLWSILSARLQGTNADQIVDPYLFHDGATFHGADFPGAHSFLIKWPLFWLTKVVGVSATSLTAITVVVVLVTVATLVYLLYRLERRPLVLGTLCLALASCLLLVPAQPSVATLLPVNMAMLATRNLEYVVYLAALGLLVGARKTRNWRFWLGGGLLGVLAASDNLFLYMSVGGAVIALLLYALRRNWRLVEVFARWLAAGILAALVSFAILAILQSSGVTHIVTSSSGAPYQTTQGAKGLALGTFYAILGFFTNFGANPAYHAFEAGQVPHQLIQGLLSFDGLGYVINAVLALAGLWTVWRLVIGGLFGRRNQATPDKAHLLSLLLVWTSIAAFGLFIGTDHYYPVDARYLTISLFAVFVAAATYSRARGNWRSKYLVIAGAVITVGIALAIPGVIGTYDDSRVALSTTNSRDKLVAQALSQHHVNVLVGDYWRVLPTKLATAGKQQILPLANCAQPRNTLTSNAWQPDLRNHSFAYLLSYDKSLTDFPDCTLAQVVAAYGRPNASILIAGNFAHPKEALLFYDHGSHQYVPPSTKITPQPLASVIPIKLDELANTSCQGPTIMNIVAHQDDDLLFMNPDLLHDIQEGHCVRTIYVTAGDAGGSQFYWLGRQQGSEDAYATMLHISDRWTQRIVKLGDTSYVTIVNPMNNPKISLLFLNLPDGGVYGQGFSSSHTESLAKLEANQISTIKTVDEESSYSKSQLITTLEMLLRTYQPAEIRTQAPDNESSQFPDHSDHLAVGRITRAAYQKYETDQYENEVTIPIKYYIGYPIHARDANVSGEDLAQKQAAFFAYAKHDGGVCRSASDCNNGPVYGAYLTRQYQE